MAKTDPDLPTIEELEKLVSKRVPLPSGDLLVKMGDFSIAHRYRVLKYGLTGLVAICLVGGGLSVLGLLAYRSKPAIIRPVKAQVKPVALIGSSVQNDSRLYRQTATDPTQAIYTAIDKAGDQVARATESSDLNLVANLANNKFLLAASTGEGIRYGVLSAEGYRQLESIPSSLTAAIGAARASGISSFGAEKIFYQYCDNTDLTVYSCDLRTFDIASNQAKTVALVGEAQSYRPRLLSVSNDRRSAYFIGMTESDRQALKAKILNAGKNAAELKELQYTQRIIQVDLATQAVTSNNAVETFYNRTSKYWLSPDGRHLVYSPEGRNGVLNYVNVTDGRAGIIKLPADDDTTQPWSGATATADPRFSPDSRYMAYVTYGTKYSTKLESLGLIDLRTRTSREIAKQPNDGTDTVNYFSNLQWDGQELSFRAGRDNRQFDLATSTIKSIDNRFGLLLANADNAN